MGVGVGALLRITKDPIVTIPPCAEAAPTPTPTPAPRGSARKATTITIQMERVRKLRNPKSNGPHVEKPIFRPPARGHSRGDPRACQRRTGSRRRGGPGAASQIQDSQLRDSSVGITGSFGFGLSRTHTLGAWIVGFCAGRAQQRGVGGSRASLPAVLDVTIGGIAISPWSRRFAATTAQWSLLVPYRGHV